MKKVMVNLQDKLILSQEIGDEKLQIAQHILDIIDNRQRQLDLDCKNLGKFLIFSFCTLLIYFKFVIQK